MSFNVLNKPLAKMNIADMGKAMEQYAKKDKGFAMRLYGEDPVEFLRASDVAHDFFDKKGRLTRQIKEQTIIGLQEEFELSPKAAKKEFHRLKIGDLFNMFGVKVSRAEYSTPKSGDVFEKRLSKMNGDDLYEVVNQLAVRNEDAAMDLYKYGADGFLDGADKEMFLPSGVMKPKTRQKLIDKFMKDSNLTEEEAVQKFATAKIGDIFPLDELTK
ncbi:MAG: hypothetical protein E7Z93_07330 [Cyanobacteria bacterium SIG32]|nr:hypothetical protein [Cyanobacteria bacterium SIG32]